MVHYGIVSDTQPVTGRVRVTLPDKDNLPTDWLPALQPYGTHVNKHFILPDEGEQVAVWLDETLTAGVVLGSFYSQEDRPDADASGPGVYALKLIEKGATVFFARIKRAALGAFTLETKAPISITAGGESLHKLLADIGTFLATHKHTVAGATTPALSPDDLVKAAELKARIELFTQD